MSLSFSEGVAALIGVPVIRAPVIIGAFVLLATVNIRGIEQGHTAGHDRQRREAVAAPGVRGLGVFFVHPDHLVITSAPPASDLARAAMILFFRVHGRGERARAERRSTRSRPHRATRAGAGDDRRDRAVPVHPPGRCWAYGTGTAKATVAPLAFAAEHFLGRPGYLLLLIGASISMFGYLSGMTLAAPRALWKFADEGLLPKWLGAIHVRFRTPHVAIIVQSLLVTALAVFNSFEQLAVIANVSALLLYGAVAVATLVLRRRDVRHDGARPFRVPGGALMPLLTVALIGWLLTSITEPEWGAMVATLAVASRFYAVRSRLDRNGASPREVLTIAPCRAKVRRKHFAGRQDAQHGAAQGAMRRRIPIRAVSSRAGQDHRP